MSTRPGCRSHALVLPSVVCATRVARDVAAATGAVTITHQHGCSQVGDDGVRTRDAFEQIACNPNVAAVVVISLGCETIQGRLLADAIAARGQRVEFVGIQDSGGSSEAVRLGVEAVERADVPAAPRPKLQELLVGVEVSRPSGLADDFVRALLDEGVSVVVAEALPSLDGVRCADAFSGDAASGATVLEGAGAGAQQHVAFAAAGAQVVVAFPDPDEAPVGFPVCPVVAVRGDSDLHVALADDFDLGADDGADALRSCVLDVASGRATAAEERGSSVFALERLAMSM
jgi:altronate dehydratase large subunit